MGNIIETVFAFNTPKFNQSLLTRPYSNRSKIILPYDKRKKDYSTSEFRLFSPHPKLPATRLNDILDELSSTKNHDANMDLTTCMAFSLVTFVILTIIFVPMFLIMMNGKGFNNIGIWILIIFTLFIALALMGAICHRFDINQEELRMMMREDEVKEVLDDLNSREFDAKGAKWSCGYGGSYLIFEDFGGAQLPYLKPTMGKRNFGRVVRKGSSGGRVVRVIRRP